MSVREVKAKPKILIVTKKEIALFNKDRVDSTIGWYLEKILGDLPLKLKVEVKGRVPTLEAILALRGQYLYRFVFENESDGLSNYLSKFYIVQI